MSDKYIVIDKTDIRDIEIPYLGVNSKGEPAKGIKIHRPYAYSCDVMGSPFESKIFTITVKLYMGTRNFPRRTVGSPLESHLLVVSFMWETEDIQAVHSQILAYVYHLHRVDINDLTNMKLKYNYVSDIPASSTKEVVDRFGTCIFIN